MWQKEHILGFKNIFLRKSIIDSETGKDERINLPKLKKCSVFKLSHLDFISDKTEKRGLKRLFQTNFDFLKKCDEKEKHPYIKCFVSLIKNSGRGTSTQSQSIKLFFNGNKYYFDSSNKFKITNTNCYEETYIHLLIERTDFVYSGYFMGCDAVADERIRLYKVNLYQKKGFFNINYNDYIDIAVKIGESADLHYSCYKNLFQTVDYKVLESTSVYMKRPNKGSKKHSADKSKRSLEYLYKKRMENMFGATIGNFRLILRRCEYLMEHCACIFCFSPLKTLDFLILHYNTAHMGVYSYMKDGAVYLEEYYPIISDLKDFDFEKNTATVSLSYDCFINYSISSCLKISRLFNDNYTIFLNYLCDHSNFKYRLAKIIVYNGSTSHYKQKTNPFEIHKSINDNNILSSSKTDMIIFVYSNNLETENKFSYMKTSLKKQKNMFYISKNYRSNKNSFAKYESDGLNELEDAQLNEIYRKYRLSSEMIMSDFIENMDTREYFKTFFSLNTKNQNPLVNEWKMIRHFNPGEIHEDIFKVLNKSSNKKEKADFLISIMNSGQLKKEEVTEILFNLT